MFKNTTRGVIAAAGLIAAATALTACSSGGAPTDSTGTEGGQPFAGQTLHVTAYAGAWQDSFMSSFVEPFEAATGATVDVATGADSDWFTQLRAAGGSNPPLDMTVFTPSVALQASHENLLEPLDTLKLDDYSTESTFLLGTTAVDGTQYGIPLSNGNLGLAYRSDLVPSAPTDWSDLWDPKYCGHVAISPITYAAGLQFLVAIVHADGGDLSNSSDVDAAFDKLAELKSCVSTYPADAASLTLALQNGDAWIAPFYDSRTFTMQDAGDPVDFVYPESGAVAAPTGYYIAKGTPNLDLAYAFMNALTDAENAVKFATATYSASGNTAVEYPDDFAAKVAHTDDQYAAFTSVDYAAAAPSTNDWQTRWSEIFG